jgi:hypothetical protein
MITSSIGLRALLATMIAAALLFALLSAAGTSLTGASGPTADSARHKGKNCVTKRTHGYPMRIRHGGKRYFCKRRKR